MAGKPLFVLRQQDHNLKKNIARCLLPISCFPMVAYENTYFYWITWLGNYTKKS